MVSKPRKFLALSNSVTQSLVRRFWQPAWIVKVSPACMALAGSSHRVMFPEASADLISCAAPALSPVSQVTLPPAHICCVRVGSFRVWLSTTESTRPARLSAWRATHVTLPSVVVAPGVVFQVGSVPPLVPATEHLKYAPFALVGCTTLPVAASAVWRWV